MSTPVPLIGGFTDEGFTTEGFTHDVNTNQTTPAWLADYYRPWRVKLEIFDKDEFELITSYDSFLIEPPLASEPPFSDRGFTDRGFSHTTPGPRNFIHLEYVDYEAQLGNNSTGTWSCIIEDNFQILDRTKIGIGNVVKIWIGQTQETYRCDFQGVIRFEQSDTSVPGTLRFFMSGFGKQYLLNERLISYNKVAKKKTVNSITSFVFDRGMIASEHVRRILTDPKVLVSNTDFSSKDTLQSIGKYDLSGIENVDIFVPSVSTFYQPANNQIDDLANQVGAEWGVESGSNTFYFRFPRSELSKDSIILKSIPDFNPGRDDPANTSYITKDTTLQIGKSNRREDGFANKLFALSSVKVRLDSSSIGTSNSTSLSGRAIAQQVKASSTKLRDLAFTMSKTGDPTGPLQGRICHDTGNDYPDEHRVICDFNISMDDIPTSSGPVYQFNLNINEQINPGDHYWIIFYQVADSTDDSSDTVLWYHDDVSDDATKPASGVRVPGDKAVDPSNPQGWTISLTGPTYAFGAFYSTPHIVTAADPFSVSKYGEVDDIVSNTNITDTQTMVQYLYSILATTGKPKIIYPSFTCTIPQSGFKPGQIVQIIDRKSGNTEEKMTLAELISVRYVFDARASGGESSAVGINKAEVTLIGYENFLNELDEIK